MIVLKKIALGVELEALGLSRRRSAVMSYRTRVGLKGDNDMTWASSAPQAEKMRYRYVENTVTKMSQEH